MNEKQELLIWRQVIERLADAANLLLALPETPETEELLAEMEGCSMGWTRPDPAAAPYLFDRVFAQLLAAEERERAAGRPGRN